MSVRRRSSPRRPGSSSRCGTPAPTRSWSSSECSLCGSYTAAVHVAVQAALTTLLSVMYSYAPALQRQMPSRLQGD